MGSVSLKHNADSGDVALVVCVTLQKTIPTEFVIWAAASVKWVKSVGRESRPLSRFVQTSVFRDLERWQQHLHHLNILRKWVKYGAILTIKWTKKSDSLNDIFYSIFNTKYRIFFSQAQQESAHLLNLLSDVFKFCWITSMFVVERLTQLQYEEIILSDRCYLILLHICKDLPHPRRNSLGEC